MRLVHSRCCPAQPTLGLVVATADVLAPDFPRAIESYTPHKKPDAKSLARVLRASVIMTWQKGPYQGAREIRSITNKPSPTPTRSGEKLLSFINSPTVRRTKPLVLFTISLHGFCKCIQRCLCIGCCQFNRLVMFTIVVYEVAHELVRVSFSDQCAEVRLHRRNTNRRYPVPVDLLHPFIRVLRVFYNCGH
jgi:hypothetical protein